MYAINQGLYEAATEYKNLNYKLKKKYVGEWVREPKFIPLNKAPNNLMCFSMNDWLTKVKPKLKEAHDAYYDKN